MKGSLKGLSGIKGMALAHGEKLGMAIVVLIALFLVYRSLQQPSLDAGHQPEKLEEQIRLAKAAVEDASFDKAPAEFRRIFQPVTKVTGNSIPEKAYNVPINWDPPVVPPVVLRTDPVLLAAQKLEANGGSGLLAFTDENTRKRRVLEEQQEADRKAKAEQKEQDRLQKESEQGKNQRAGAAAKGERGGRGGEVVDPEHPNRRLVSGMARQAGIPTAGDEEIRTAYWATVLAKVPIKDQIKLYRDAFENARGYVPETDFPRYLGFRVERAEVLPGQETKDLKFSPIQIYNGKGQVIGNGKNAVSAVTINGREGAEGKDAVPGIITDWAAQTPEIVDPRYLDDGGALTVPLPPLVGRDWGAEATHSQIPLTSKATDSEEEAPKPADDKQATPATPEEEFAASDAAAAGPRSRASLGRGRDERGGGRGMPGRGYGGERAPSVRGGERGAGRESLAGARGATRGGTSGDMAPQVSFLLLRFFDFGVEPGKKYKYRVQLVLEDPNQSASPETLDTAVVSRLKAEKAAKHGHYRTTDGWSDPSPIVSIPLAGNVHVAAAKPASDRFNDEPAATLLVDSFGSDDKGKSTQAAKEEDFKRGYVANMTKDGESLINEGSQIFTDLLPKFQFRTGITVLDIDGGEPLAKDVKKPARVLLMDPAGQLFVQNEVDDEEVVQLHRDTFADPDKRGGRPGARGEPGPPTGRDPRGAGGFQQGFGRGER
jgi:hypothetical protein